MAGQIVVPNSTEVVLPPRLDELEAHLDDLAAATANDDDNDTTTAAAARRRTATPDAELFEQVQLHLTDAACLRLLPDLLPPLTQILTASDANLDIAPITNLLTRLTRPLSFAAVLALVPVASLIACLDSPAEPTNALGLALLTKAAPVPAALAAHPLLVRALLRAWLASPSALIGDGIGRLLAAALRADCRWGAGDAAEAEVGSGVLWRAIFDDPVALRAITDPTLSPAPPSAASPRQRTLAQDRLLRLLPRLAVLDLPYIARRGGGLLRAAALDMVVGDGEEDAVMRACLCDFFVELVCVMRRSRWAGQPEWIEVVRAVVQEGARRWANVLEAVRRVPSMVVAEEEDGEGMAEWVAFLLDRPLSAPL